MEFVKDVPDQRLQTVALRMHVVLIPLESRPIEPVVLTHLCLQAPILPTYYSHLAREEPSKKRASNAAQAPSTTPDPAKAVPAQQPHAGPQYGAPQPKYAWNESAGPVQMVQQPHPHQYGPHLPPQPVARPNGFPMARPPSGPPFSGE
jgi:hypothetical protein